MEHTPAVFLYQLPVSADGKAFHQLGHAPHVGSVVGGSGFPSRLLCPCAACNGAAAVIDIFCCFVLLFVSVH